jgi:hypothetical protein
VKKMSFDLYFYRKTSESEPEKGFSRLIKGITGKSDEKIEDKAMLEFLSSYENFPGPEITRDGFDSGYLNEKTGTHVVFSQHRRRSLLLKPINLILDIRTQDYR